MSTIGQKFGSATKKAENMAGNLFTHFKTGPGLVNVAMNRIDHAARSVYEGSDHVFRKEFGYNPGEKLKKTYACYLSITGGPISGTLFISNLRVGFKSDSPVWTGPGSGPGQWVYYKVIMWVNDIGAVNSVANKKNSGEKYIEIVSKDGHEFWFMGFIFYEQALHNLYQVKDNCNAEVVAYPYTGH
ncbi:GEM-like protein 5 [Bienertia sinuspersici]